MKKHAPNFFKSLLVFLPFFASAQSIDDSNQKPPPADKATIVFLHSFMEDAVINNLFLISPFFIDDTLVCRMTNHHYSIHTVVPGTHKLSVQNSGKKLGKRVITQTVTVKAGETVYYMFYNEFDFFKEELLFEYIESSKAKKILRRLVEEQDCIKTINTKRNVYNNKKFHVQLQTGSSNYTNGFTNWKSWFGDILMTSFNPFTVGGELDVRMGKSNHYIGFEINSNTQRPPVLTTPLPNGEKRWVNIRQIGFLYRYIVQIDKKNKMILAPKVGLGIINVEEKTNKRSISDKVIDSNGGFSLSLGLQPEYRFTNNFSAFLNTDYIIGALNAPNRDNLVLNQFRLFVGVKYQFFD